MAKRKKALIAEQDAGVGALLKAHLERLGWKALLAADGEQALRMFKDARPDLVLLEVRLPELDGFAVCRRIRTLRDVPVLFLTERDAAHDARGARIHGGSGFVTKPVRLAELRLRLDEIRNSPEKPIC
ncbi:MAG: response regulator [Elusimicrobiota bacterium]